MEAPTENTSPSITTFLCSKNLPQFGSYRTENMTLHKRMKKRTRSESHFYCYCQLFSN